MLPDGENTEIGEKGINLSGAFFIRRSANGANALRPILGGQQVMWTIRHHLFYI